MQLFLLVYPKLTKHLFNIIKDNGQILKSVNQVMQFRQSTCKYLHSDYNANPVVGQLQPVKQLVIAIGNKIWRTDHLDFEQ